MTYVFLIVVRVNVPHNENYVEGGGVMCKHKCFPKTLLLFLSVALNILLLMVIFILLARPKELFSYNLTEIIGLFISVCIS